MARRIIKPKTSEANTKGGQSTTYRALKPIAKEINYRLGKAEKSDDDAWDHRLAVVLRLKDAEETCKKGKVKFKDWADENINQKPETIRKMLAIGKANNPERALQEARERNALANRRLRARKKIEAEKVAKQTGQPKPKNDTPPETPVARVEKALHAMGDEPAANLIQSKASDYGLAVVTVAEAKAARASKERSSTPPTLEDFKKLWYAAAPSTRLEISEWVEAAQDADNQKTTEMAAVPEFLKAQAR